MLEDSPEYKFLFPFTMIFLRTHILQVAVPGLELSFYPHQSNVPSQNYVASRQTLTRAPFWQLLLKKDHLPSAHSLSDPMLAAQRAGLQPEPHDQTIQRKVSLKGWQPRGIGLNQKFPETTCPWRP